MLFIEKYIIPLSQERIFLLKNLLILAYLFFFIFISLIVIGVFLYIFLNIIKIERKNNILIFFEYLLNVIITNKTVVFVLCLLSIVSIILIHKEVNYPKQPISFSHKIHVNLGLQCNFCHNFTDKSTKAGVPETKKCMDCHKKVSIDKPEIKKLTQYSEQKKAISWNQIYYLPSYVYFSHKRHVKANIDCSFCHGDVKTMDNIIKVKSLKMYWCISCHKLYKVSTDCLICHK